MHEVSGFESHPCGKIPEGEDEIFSVEDLRTAQGYMSANCNGCRAGHVPTFVTQFQSCPDFCTENLVPSLLWPSMF